METTRKEKCDRGACVRPYTERPAATISYFFSCVVETVQTNNKISKVPRVGEIMLAYSLQMMKRHKEETTLQLRNYTKRRWHSLSIIGMKRYIYEFEAPA